MPKKLASDVLAGVAFLLSSCGRPVKSWSMVAFSRPVASPMRSEESEATTQYGVGEGEETSGGTATSKVERVIPSSLSRMADPTLSLSSDCFQWAPYKQFVLT